MCRFSRLIVLGIFALISITWTTAAHAQEGSRKELEKRKQQLKQDLEFKSKLLDQTRQTKKQSISQLAIIDNKITQRERLIVTINQEIGLIDQRMAETLSVIQALENDLEVLKAEYARMIQFAYKNRSAYDRLMFLFASDDFNQAFKRLKYLQQYSAFRKRQAEIIAITQSELSRKQRELEARKTEKQRLLQSKEDEKEYLAKELDQKQNLVAELSSKEQELKDEIDKKQREAKALTKAIELAIAEEIRKQKEAEKKTGVFGLTPEAQALSSNFLSNKQKLPWPVEKGVITETFGEHAHPVLKGIKIQNNGINIGTNEGAIARAVFDGEVSGVIVIPGAGKAVLVRHGEYLSVYSQLREVYVQKGQKVSTKQNVGVVLTDVDKGTTELHFEIWQGKSTLNPAEWIFRGN